MNVTNSKSLIYALANCQNYDTILVQSGVYEFTPLLPTSETWTSHPGSGGAALCLSMKKGVRIIGEEGALLKFLPGSGLCVYRCGDIEISGISFKGPGYTLIPEKWYCAHLLLSGTNSRIHVHDCRFEDAPNHGIGHLAGESTDDSIFEHNTFLRGGHLNRPADIEGQPALGGDGAALAVRGSRNIYRRNQIEAWLRGIEIEAAPTNEASNNIVEANELRNVFWHGIFITPTGLRPERCQRNIIRRNLLVSGPGMGAFTMAHPIYVSGGYSQLIEDNTIYGKAGDWCGIDASADHCDLTPLILGNRVFGTGRFGAGLGFNGKPAGELSALVGGNELVGCGGAGIGYLGTLHKVWSNRIIATVPDGGVCRPIYAPDDPGLSCCWDN